MSVSTILHGPISEMLTGKSGGQTATGGIASGDGLTLQSTTHGTKGSVTIGTYLVVDEQAGSATITGKDAVLAALDVKGNVAAENSSFLQRWIAPQQPAGNSPAAYIYKDGSFSTRASIVVSGTVTGSGSTYFIQGPNQAATPISQYMIGVVNDLGVNSSSIVTQSSANSNNHYVGIDHSNAVKFQVTENGETVLGGNTPVDKLDVRGAGVFSGASTLLAGSTDLSCLVLQYTSDNAIITSIRNGVVYKPLVLEGTAISLNTSTTGSGGPSTKFRVTQAGNVQVTNGVLATNVTDGFLYLPTMPGGPSATPTNISNLSAMCWDDTNFRLKIYSVTAAGWKTLQAA